MFTIELGMAQTVGVAAVFLVLGDFIKARVPVLNRYFIPGPIIGGLVFSLITLAGHLSGTFYVSFYDTMRDFLLLVFFTTIGFSASLELLKKGGVGVALFLVAAVGLVVLQNVLGVGLASAMGTHPLIGLAAGSISLTGGHGTSAAFGPILEAAGAIGALPAAIAASTFGLVTGCLIGGPVGKLLMRRHAIPGRDSGSGRGPRAALGEAGEATDATAHLADELPDARPHDAASPTAQAETEDDRVSKAVMAVTLLIAFSIGTGTLLVQWVADFGLTLPAYLGPMLVAAAIRNILDWRGIHMPRLPVTIVGDVSLAFFLVMALMAMKLWELAEIAGPLFIILVVQTVVMFAYAYFVTFRLMGKDYDAVVIAAGHCGFGMGATPNAMANMQSFTAANGPSVKAFFVIPLVGSLFIDFINAVIITAFAAWFG